MLLIEPRDALSSHSSPILETITAYDAPSSAYNKVMNALAVPRRVKPAVSRHGALFARLLCRGRSTLRRLLGCQRLPPHRAPFQLPAALPHTPLVLH